MNVIILSQEKPQMQGFGTQWYLWCTQAWNICLAIMNQVAFPASELHQLSRHPCDVTEWWFMGLLANGVFVPTLHRWISAAVGRWVTSDPAELPILPGWNKSYLLAPLNIIPDFRKEKHQYLSDLSSKSNTFLCFICQIIKIYQVFFKTLSDKNGVCDE